MLRGMTLTVLIQELISYSTLFYPEYRITVSPEAMWTKCDEEDGINTKPCVCVHLFHSTGTLTVFVEHILLKSSYKSSEMDSHSEVFSAVGLVMWDAEGRVALFIHGDGSVSSFTQLIKSPALWPDIRIGESFGYPRTFQIPHMIMFIITLLDSYDTGAYFSLSIYVHAFI